MNLAHAAENLGVSNLGHFDSKLEGLCRVSTTDDQPAIAERRTGLETLEAGSYRSVVEIKTPLLVVYAHGHEVPWGSRTRTDENLARQGG